MHDTAVVASRGKTAVAVVTAEFTALARTIAANAGRPGLRVLELPHPIETRPDDEVRAVAAARWPALLDALGASGDRAR